MKKLSKVMLALTAVCSLAVVGCNKSEGASSGSKSAKEYQGVKAQKDPATKKIYDFGGLEVTEQLASVSVQIFAAPFGFY